MVEFGAKLKKLRTEEGLTQQQLGDLLGVSKSVVSYYEVNERIPSPDTLVIDDLIFHDDLTEEMIWDAAGRLEED